MILHAPGGRYQLFDYQFTEVGLEGHLKPFEGGNLNTLHVFTHMNFSPQGHSNTMLPLVIPQENIQKIKYAQHSTLKTVLFIGGIIALISFAAMKSLSFSYL